MHNPAGGKLTRLAFSTTLARMEPGGSKRIRLAFLLALLFPAVASAAYVRVAGVVLDSAGAVVKGARLQLQTAQQTIVPTSQSDDHGRFAFTGVRPGSYLLVVEAAGFARLRLPVRAGAPGSEDLRVTLGLETVEERVTVTAHPSLVEEADTVSQPVNVIPAETIALRAKAVVAQVAEEEVGVHLQRTSPTLAGIFVRGLTGNKVNVFVDGVRYSTAAQRGGINTFLDLISPAGLDAVEILRGPNSAQYGSDAIGGSVHFVSAAPAYSAGGFAFRGSFSPYINTADASAGSHLSTTLSTPRFSLLANFAGQRTSTLRTGRGLDSHSAFTRFFGLPSRLFMGDRRPDTAFTPYAGLLRLSWSPAAETQLIAHYGRSQQDGGRRTDLLLGGDGNLVADLRNLMLDFFYVRFDRQRAGWFDDVTGVYSFNSQREMRVNQGGNGNPLAAIHHEYERTSVHGLQGTGARRAGNHHELLVGGEFYHERIVAPSFGFDPVAQTAFLRRPRVPDRARYRSGGVFVQDVFTVVPGRLRVVGDLRYGAAAYRARAAASPLVAGRPLWPDDRLWTSAVTFRAGAVVTPAEGLNLSANFSRGFRAPHMTDLGTLGLTGAGFEVAAPDLAGLNATVGSTAGADAVSTGLRVRQLKPETSLGYEVGLRYHHARFSADFTFFVNDLYDVITKQALILPPGAVGTILGGEPIVAQNPNGVVFVGVSTSPVLVRTNFDRARLYGFEHTATWQITPRWLVRSVLTYIHAADRRTGDPPNLEGGTPAPDGYLKLLYTPGSGRFWIEPYLHGALRQARLSSLDLEDRRTGATRSVASISSFFLHGATVRGLVASGPDAMFGTADDVLLATGETLAQILARVLGPGLAPAPLFRHVPAYFTLGLRGGVRVGEQQDVVLDFSNITDRNYRGISWGLEAPGRSLAVRYTARF
jgi:outer membrane receptor protein involved in Fe transport